MDWQTRYAGRMGKVQPSPIMDLIRVLSQRPVINFASGLPDPAGFPVKALTEAAEQILTEDWRAALQYGEAEGYRPLREWVAADLTSRGVPTETAQVLIVSGSQQGIDLVARAFLQPGDIVLTEEPSYLAALQVFASFEANVQPIRTDEANIKEAVSRRPVKNQTLSPIAATSPSFAQGGCSILPLKGERVL